MLVNNGYPQDSVEDSIRTKINTTLSQSPTRPKAPSINFYKSTMNRGYKEDEKILTNIIHKNVTPTKSNTKINLIIYYKTKKTQSSIIKNYCLPPSKDLQETNVMYECNAKYKYAKNKKKFDVHRNHNVCQACI